MVVAKKQEDGKATIALTIFDGTRELFPLTRKGVLLRVRDGQQTLRYEDYVKTSTVSIRVPFSNNFVDNYTVLVTADGYRDAGFFPLKVSLTHELPVDLMLVPKKATYQFLPWDDLKAQYPLAAKFFACAGRENEAKGHYEELRQNKPAALASLLNLTAAMSTIQLPRGTPLDYFKRIEWDSSLAQDRFFAFADAAIVQQVRTAASQGEFAPEPSPGMFHGDATSSYKQVQFGEANVQLTFHEKTVESIDGIQCIRIEPDIDYYKDLGAHALMEVIPNTLTHGLTDPQVVYVLRWIAGRHAGVPEFDPSYLLV
jgi:hypothetical protein